VSATSTLEAPQLVSSASRRPRIAVFDSGVGGLTVLRAIVALIPNADYIYFGDTARLPYGSKSRETVARYTVEAAKFLETHEPDILVIGCNTASALALYDIKAAVHVPVIGVIEPGAESAAQVSVSREAVVLATEATVGTHAYQRALARRGFATHEKACPLLVPLVEEGWIDHPVTEQVARIYMSEALRAAAHTDVLVLGCTHYPLIKALLRRVVPDSIAIVDSAEATAHAIFDELKYGAQPSQKRNSRPERRSPHAPRFTFYVTDSVEKFARMAPLFLGHPVLDVHHIDLGG
jgi:glutamate racemase